MADKPLDFETHYEDSKCQCGDERLELDWDDTDLVFVAECGCMKRHELKPTICTIKVIEN
jgi:hypothetical protein